MLVSAEEPASPDDDFEHPTILAASLFTDCPILPLKSEGLERRVRCGNPITLPEIPDGTYRIYSQDRQFLCLSQARAGTLTSIKNFFGA